MSAPQQRPLRLAGATLPDGTTATVTVTADRVTQVGGAGAPASPAEDAQVLDLTGYVLLPALAEPHAHLDKSLTWDVIQPPVGDLVQAIDSWRRYAAGARPSDTADRARRSLRMLLDNGCTAVRTHVDVAGPETLGALEAVLSVREEVRGVVDLQVVPLVFPDATDATLAGALDLGPDLLGGLAHLADDPSAELTRLLAAADRAGVGLDLHTDEELDPRTATLLDLAQRVSAGAVTGPVTASHCCSLGVMEPARRDEIVEAVVRAGIGVVTNPQTNLYLQGRGWATSPPRGLTAVRALLDAGALVAGGGDNLHDPFNPMGRADPLETASLLVTAGHLDVAEAFAAVTSGARAVMGLAPAGPVVGAVADLVAVRASSLTDAVAVASAERVVISRGRVVSTTRLTRTTVWDEPA